MQRYFINLVSLICSVVYWLMFKTKYAMSVKVELVIKQREISKFGININLIAKIGVDVK